LFTHRFNIKSSDLFECQWDKWCWNLRRNWRWGWRLLSTRSQT